MNYENNKMIVALFEKELDPDGSNLNQFRRFAFRMLEFQGNEIDPKEKGPG